MRRRGAAVLARTLRRLRVAADGRFCAENRDQARGSQYVTMPAEFHFLAEHLAARCDPENGDVIVSELPNLVAVIAVLDEAALAADLMRDQNRGRRPSGGS